MQASTPEAVIWQGEGAATIVTPSETQNMQGQLCDEGRHCFAKKFPNGVQKGDQQQVAAGKSVEKILLMQDTRLPL